MLFSHRQGVLYLEHCRIQASDGQLSLVRAQDALERHWSIPHGNVCALLLGPGTSITHQAAHKLGEEQVMLGFVGGGGAPLFFASQSEYRPTEYCQAWVSQWADPGWRLHTAKQLAKTRCAHVHLAYFKEHFWVSSVETAVAEFSARIDEARTTEELLGFEANFAKALYRFHADRAHRAFVREPRGADTTNGFIDSGNYLMYGLAASVLWVLGIPHAFPVTHGMTRRGALVFDLADVLKDAILLPVAFDCASDKSPAATHRARCMAAIDKHDALKALFNVMKAVTFGKEPADSKTTK